MAGKITQEDVDKVRQTADLYEIVSADVQLKSAGGGRFMGLCPFHDDKSPSMSVNPQMGLWHCFACGAGGDTFKYIEQRDGVDFRGAVELLADQYHIELHYEHSGTGKPREERSTRQRLLDANEEAQRFFVDQIAHNPEAVVAHKMLDGRNFSWNDAMHFGCGYAPKGWDNLVRHLSEKGFTQQEMLDAGLARRGNNGTVYDYFRGRATWPIRDTAGNTLGFGARKLFDDDNAGKYLNTPDTALYRKSQVLYGLDLAKNSIQKKRQAVIVEGYTDVMAMHLAGIDTAVATCGTAFGKEHANIIRRLISDDKISGIQLVGPQKVEGQTASSRVVFTFDGDAAGRKGALRAFGLDTSFQAQTFVAVARDNLDPCDLRIYHGDEAVRSLIDHASPLYDFVMRELVSHFDLQYTTGQVGAMKAVAPILAQIRDRSMYDMYVRKMAGMIGVEVDVMRKEANVERSRQHVRDEDAYAQPQGYRSNSRYEQVSPSQQRVERLDTARRNARRQQYFAVDDTVFMTEQQFMALVLQAPYALEPELFGALTVDSFMVPAFRGVFQALVVAGGLPNGQPAQAWNAHVREVAGPVIMPVIDELSVMDVPVASHERFGSRGETGRPDADHPSESQRTAVDDLAKKLLDLGYMRRIAAMQMQMDHMPEGPEKIAMLRSLVQLERERAQLRAR